ncbi:acetyl-CoA carboxylase biotin carboxyl carrier protein [Candidatus Blochmannia ocreatus (nom. nud.)]|uniref:Biotin carboxyl carrier protein of acetyl-CoA carboxylase n=1 Tax=Candidatus Blochmannia ocreatus (nom. nud.) TaxID=251538 RepID=A0ABY4SYK9_9ENTR|nr:acetyl-CoA carboxylase biotin carboxyl carrier protein [Candidatus Blochmannia ocreatus]URJ25353.1 acetyl-CoA carboxylase biotin carboxyl carrier protein [Candidatus Blochmannia ocreatus]
MDIRKIKKIIKLIEESNISKLEIVEGNKAIRVDRLTRDMSSALNYASVQSESDIAVCDSTNIDTKNYKHSKLTNGYIVRSPMVGIFYAAPNKQASPFVSVGQMVKVGDILCIIEAMKVMNQIQSDKSGTIKSIFLKNGQPVEFNEPLFVIE